MSFSDEGDEPRTTRQPRQRRPQRAPGGARGTGSPAAPDRQTLLVRQGVAGLVALLVIILLVVGINSCRGAAHDNALRDYNREVGTIASESDELGQQLFGTVAQQSLQPVDQQTQVNQLRVRAQQQAERARRIDTPGDMAGAQTNFLLTLDLRADSVAKIASRIVVARGDQEGAAEAALNQIAGEMQSFLASDVVYLKRVVPFIQEALADADIGGQRIVGARFMDDITWLQPSTVASRIGASAAGTQSNQQVAPGRHGHGLTGVSVGDTALQPQPATNRIPATADLAFTVRFTNQGENEETGVRVRVRVRPQTGKTISVTRPVDQTNPGAEAEVNVPLGQTPPTGTSTTVTVEVLRVPGEENVENNSQEYTVLFTR
ncbi:MAG: hypothetical protein QOG77_3935 [Solirubrobacteraceae bacterium]|nr:hypothetical protein [Solirubrobacteraceae bacterium]